MTGAFNSPLEIGVRSLAILTAVFPDSLDIDRLVFFDYLAIHSGDVNGPESLHASLPLRSGELAIRRELIERGLLLMISRGLAEILAMPEGFTYRASESANAFLARLTAIYIVQLRKRATWVAEEFGQSSLNQLEDLEKRFLRAWSPQFQSLEQVGKYRV